MNTRGAEIIPVIRWAIDTILNFWNQFSVYTGIEIPVLDYNVNIPFTWILIACILLGIALHVVNFFAGGFLNSFKGTIVSDTRSKLGI